MPNLDAVIATLGAICGQEAALLPHRPRIEDFFEGDGLLQSQTEEVFGPSSEQRLVRIMVTMPSEASVLNLLAEIVELFCLLEGGFYKRLAVYGHVGRTDIGLLPWEETDKVPLLQSFCGQSNIS